MKDFHVRRGAHWMVVSLFLAVAGCGGDSPTDGGTGSDYGGGGGGGGGGDGPTVTTSVTVSNDFFDPASIQVSPGATVTWEWAGGSAEGHNVTFSDPTIDDAPTQITGMFQAAMLMAAGVYNYECTNHLGMNGSVTVL